MLGVAVAVEDKPAVVQAAQVVQAVAVMAVSK